MNTIDLQTEIIQLPREERNTGVLEAIRMLLRRKEVKADEDVTAEELTELDKRRDRRRKGESRGHTAEESIRMLRAAHSLTRASTLVSSPRSHYLHHQGQTLHDRRRPRILDLE